MKFLVLYDEWRNRKRLLGKLCRISQKQAVERSANWLLERLYKPVKSGYRLDARAYKEIPGVEDEPINWGDLSASVERKSGVWRVTLEEASPGQCPALCRYVQTWLETWGWKPVIVETEW